jgi:hypothetical protein
MTTRALLLFARTPREGEVKTRLVPAHTPAEALELHRALLADSLGLLRRAARSAAASPFLYLSEPDPPDPDLAGRLEGIPVVAQQGSDLGERLLRALQERLLCGARRVVVIGSDAPHLPAGRITRAFEELERSEVVLGPARDGGYYLVGASRLHPVLFRGIPWGTGQVFRETVRKARREKIPVASLPAWDDVDRPESVALLWKSILHLEELGSEDLPRVTAALLRRWQREGKTL